MKPLNAITILLLSLAALYSNNGLVSAQQQQPQAQQATIVLPANVVVQQPGQQQQQGTAAPPQAVVLQPQSSEPPPPPPTDIATAQQEELAKKCPPIDEEIAKRYDAFFLLLRLVNLYTQDAPTQPTASMNSTYEPLTFLVPESSTVEFLRSQNIDIRELATDPLKSVLLAASLAQHIVRGYWPSNALPVDPVPTLCSNCPPVQFSAEGDRVRVLSGSVNVTITNLDVVNCPGRYVLHTVDDYFYVPVSDPLFSATSALNIALSLGGLFDTFEVAGEPGASSVSG